MAVLDRQRQVDSCDSLPTLTYLMSYGPVKDPIAKNEVGMTPEVVL